MNIDLLLQNLTKALSPDKYQKLHIAVISTVDDQKIAQRVINTLRALGIKTWYAEDVLPGQDWKLEHGRAYKEADLVFFLVSKSTIKEGQHNRYVRLVLDIQMEKPESGLKLIPIRLEKCEMPDLLSDLRYLDGASADDIQKIAKSWDIEASRRDKAKDWPKYRDFKTKWE